MSRSRRGLRVGTALLLIALAAVVGVGSGRVGDAGARPAGVTAMRVPILPRLGPIETVDQNDVGDPFIIKVPPGVSPPTGVPYRDSGPDAYVSAPWTAATAREARANGWYVLVGTTDWVANVPTAISTDLVHWTQAPDALPVLPSWAQPSISMTWGPSVLRTHAGWVLYFSTQEANSQLECIGSAVSSSPAGPYTDRSSSPLVCQQSMGGSIDPSVIRGQDGSEFLIWKNDGNAIQAPVSIWSEQLTADGLGLTGEPQRLLGVDQPWQKGIIEAPAMTAASAGGYWLFYAGGKWNSDAYGTGMAYCRAVTGPCVETSGNPFLSTTASVISPASLDTFTDSRGQLWAAFTALVAMSSPWHPGHVYYNRVLDIARILSD